MKSYFLEGLSETTFVRDELSNLLPRQTDPWLLMTSEDDPIAYFKVEVGEDGMSFVQADMSGRHFNEDTLVLKVLKDLQSRVGGDISSDDDDQV